MQFFFFVFFPPKWQKHSILSKPFIEEILDRLVHLPHLCLVYVKRILEGRTVRIRRST